MHGDYNPRCSSLPLRSQRGALYGNCSVNFLPPSTESVLFYTMILNVKVKVAQLCPTLSDPMNCSPPGFSVRGILRARILEWVVMPFSSGYSHIAGGLFTI